MTEFKPVEAQEGSTVINYGSEVLALPFQQSGSSIGVICDRSFERECLVESLRNLLTQSVVRGYEDEGAWQKENAEASCSDAILLCLGAKQVTEAETKDRLRTIVAQATPCRVIVLGESDSTKCFIEAVECGATTYISASVGLEDLIAAIRVSSPRSVLMPRKSVLALREAFAVGENETCGLDRHFTERQLDVALALQRGAANKTIAYELDLCESTVKVHIRNIMRKLNATNRTQAAFRLNQISNGTFHPEQDLTVA